MVLKLCSTIFFAENPSMGSVPKDNRRTCLGSVSSGKFWGKLLLKTGFEFFSVVISPLFQCSLIHFKCRYTTIETSFVAFGWIIYSLHCCIQVHAHFSIESQFELMSNFQFLMWRCQLITMHTNLLRWL